MSLTDQQRIDTARAILADADTEDDFAEILGNLTVVLGDDREPGEVGRVDVSAAMPGPMMVVFATSIEVSSVEHDDLGLLLELAFDTPGGGYSKVILPDESAPMLATAIVDGSTAAREAQEAGRIERVSGKLWTPGG